jgi:hypothetical protein
MLEWSSSDVEREKSEMSTRGVTIWSQNPHSSSETKVNVGK